MLEISVWKDDGMRFCRLLDSQLENGAFSQPYRISALKEDDVWEQGDPDITIWLPHSPMPSLRKLFVKTLVVSGDDASTACAVCTAQTVITAGFGARDTLTPSSVFHCGGSLIALQREFTSFTGESVYPQELILSGIPGSIEEQMLIRAVLLLCGI